MDDLRNMMRQIATEVASQHATHRFGIVDSVNAAEGTARVIFDEGDPANGVPPTKSGWLPILQMGGGQDWSFGCLPEPGTQVYVGADMGDPAHGVIIGVAHFTQQPPGQVTPYGAQQQQPQTPGQAVIQHRSGATIRMVPGGVEITGFLKVNGEVIAFGNVTDLNGAHGSLNVLRDDYDQHDHQHSVGLTTRPTP